MRKMTKTLTARYLGIDGGGSATTAWVADERDHVLGRGAAGPSNPVKVGLTQAKQEILAATGQALAAASKVELYAACAGLAGVDRPQMSEPLLTWLRTEIPAQIHLLTTDAAITLEAALGRAPGVVVISGTGSIACGRDREGRMMRSGGWGSVFGDEGSAYDIGRRGVNAALRALDGVGLSTRLAQDISGSLDLAEISEIVGLNLAPRQIAALAPLVLEAERKDDAAGCQIVFEAGRELAQLAAALLVRLGLNEEYVHVVLAGGLLRSSRALRRSLRRHLASLAPQAQVGVLRREPVQGALALARRANGRGSAPDTGRNRMLARRQRRHEGHP
ncbi:MAG TPA: BadF/BadG/BcrA/BcrD ATPase family protein [Terriglobia bacterium]|nr:BadF/BadG/BcrA/BcrD ATPase family protein [Terriglobia bacterium]